jgi:ABC-type transporter Mla maintaining outer membrane lipid asymmetry ATPase subunit MlaF
VSETQTETFSVIVKVEGLSKTFGKLKAADNVTFDIKVGEIFGFVGPARIAKQKNRSTRTIQVHVSNHNEAIHRAGFCAACKRAGSSHFKLEAIRKRIEKNITSKL